ncbi:MAG: hypothetical protein QMC07_04510 [Flavobacteriaceae bacterium]|jgi:hypothetical protein
MLFHQNQEHFKSFLEKLNLTTLHQLKATSKKYQFDGAMFTTIEIVWDDKKYIKVQSLMMTVHQKN